MTRKELVSKHMPHYVGFEFDGGVKYCPSSSYYSKFMPRGEIIKVNKKCDSYECGSLCTECWNTEIEEDNSNTTIRFIRKSTDNDNFYLNGCGENCQHDYQCEGKSPTEFICPSLQQAFEKLYKFEEVEEKLFKKMNNILD